MPQREMEGLKKELEGRQRGLGGAPERVWSGRGSKSVAIDFEPIDFEPTSRQGHRQS